MKAEEVYNIAIHLPEKELERLYTLLDKRMNSVTISKTKKRILVTDKEAIDYLLKNVFFKNINSKKDLHL